MNLKEWRGFKGKTPFLPPPRVQNRGGGWGAPAATRFGPPGPRQRPGLRGKERGSRGGLIPGLTSSDGGAWRPGYCDQRRRSYKVGGGGARGAGSS